jgi:hypothetical protein
LLFTNRDAPEDRETFFGLLGLGDVLLFLLHNSPIRPADDFDGGPSECMSRKPKGPKNKGLF